MENVLLCPTCEYDYNHLICTLNFVDNDEYKTTKVIINNKHEIALAARYDYRSQGNIHLLFVCESGHYHSKSFDGHKGNIFVDKNNLMVELVNHLNDREQEDEYSLSLNYQLLGKLEKYFQSLSK